ncbi:MAG: hypothetical protein PHS97_03950 [Oscillospiraceae bacterium]|nr:hypothetical protein [Oscillospiraceae bacterium]
MKKSTASVLCGICVFVCAVIALLMIAALVGLLLLDHAPVPLLLYFLLIFVCLLCAAVGVIVVLRQRLQELKKGEIEDAASKY